MKWSDKGIPPLEKRKKFSSPTGALALARQKSWEEVEGGIEGEVV